jgi:two-component system, chemotaxis family, protein-glutamate methylesterase/glutaminase
LSEVTEARRSANDAFDVVVMGASSGGLYALSTILAALPADFPAAISIVQHRHPQQETMLAEILSCRSLLVVRDASEGDRLKPGLVHLAPRGKHLLVKEDGLLFLSDGPKVKFCRPAADKLFETAAESHRERVIAVVLTGGNDDGADGVRGVKRMGGTVIAQDRKTSEAFWMPHAAISTGVVDFVLPLDEIAPALVALARSAR